MSLKFKMATHQDLPPRNLPPLPGPSTITDGPDLLATTTKKKKRLSAGITGSDSQLSSSALASRGGVDGVEDGASANGSVDNVWEPQQDRQERKARQRKKRQSRNVEEEGAGTDLSEKSKRQSKALDDEEGKDKVAVSPRQRRRHHRGRRGENTRNPAASPKTKRNVSRQGVTTFLTQTSESSGVTPSPRTARKAQIKCKLHAHFHKSEMCHMHIFINKHIISHEDFFMSESCIYVSHSVLNFFTTRGTTRVSLGSPGITIY
ncbi:uncharacterized protein LOC118419399 [Branchiostoma floridae]|uniref:Uncharacterized protein LOC118419399 n=1 Tax=Branchiostoma floridae TaxID=7739 RepID=A0A9J7LGG4_BRAFL|nr:uncharacterized protein LOC118419399 [Branchiostoma floridae]